MISQSKKTRISGKVSI